MATGEGKQNEREWKVRGITPAPSDDNPLADQLQATQRRLEAISRQMDGMGRRVDGMSYTLDQLRPATERVLSDHQMVQAVLQATETLALQVQGFLNNRMINEQVPPETQALYKMQAAHAVAHQRRQDEVDRNLGYIQRLMQCQQELTDLCPCGNHRGVRLTDETGRVLEDNLCPKHWWVMQSRVAYKNGNLSEFTSSYPFSDYLFAYSVV